MGSQAKKGAAVCKLADILHFSPLSQLMQHDRSVIEGNFDVWVWRGSFIYKLDQLWKTEWLLFQLQMKLLSLLAFVEYYCENSKNVGQTSSTHSTPPPPSILKELFRCSCDNRFSICIPSSPLLRRGIQIECGVRCDFCNPAGSSLLYISGTQCLYPGSLLQ